MVRDLKAVDVAEEKKCVVQHMRETVPVRGLLAQVVRCSAVELRTVPAGYFHVGDERDRFFRRVVPRALGYEDIRVNAVGEPQNATVECDVTAASRE